MEKRDYPIIEYSYEREAIIEPVFTRHNLMMDEASVPDACVITFFRDAFEDVVKKYSEGVISVLKAESVDTPIHCVKLGGMRVALVHCMLGSPFAAGLLDELIPLGIKRFVACGGAGVLNREVAVGHLMVCESAVRDEGTSYHYLPPAREVRCPEDIVGALVRVLEKHDIPHIVAKTWTTDAFYRETRERMEARRAEGCIAVEMECAAFLAAAEFRGVRFGQYLYGGDNLDGEKWDNREWISRTDVRERLIWLSAEAVNAL